MQWIFEHIVAVIVGATIILIIMATNLSGQDAAVEAIQFSTAKTELHLLVEVLEQDIANIGAGQLDPADANIEIDTTSTTRRFAFDSRTDPTSDEPQRVEYEWEEVGDITLSTGTVVPLITLSRSVDGTETTVSDGIITDLRVTLRNPQLQPIMSPMPTDLAATRRIDVSMRMISPMGKAEVIEEARWERRIRPLNLQRPGGELILN